MHRIELADGQPPDMACGVNGMAQQTWFRPTHIDVEFDPKGVVEKRIYGPQIKQDDARRFAVAMKACRALGE